MARKKKLNRKIKGSIAPPVSIGLFAIAALVLIPWTLWLSFTLPPNHLDRRWNQVWTGFDVGMLVSLALTAFWSWRRSGWAIASSAVAGTFLLIDSWFDCITTTPGPDYLVSLLSACIIELPLALVAFWITYKAGKRFLK